MLFALLFNQVTLTEFWQISLFLLLLWPIEPIVLRMKERTLSVVIVAAVTILLIAVVICNVSKRAVKGKNLPASIPINEGQLS